MFIITNEEELGKVNLVTSNCIFIRIAESPFTKIARHISRLVERENVKENPQEK